MLWHSHHTSPDALLANAFTFCLLSTPSQPHQRFSSDLQTLFVQHLVVYVHLFMIMQRVISRHFPILNSGQLSGPLLNSVPCFLVLSRSRLERQFVTSARVFDEFRGISCFVIFDVTRAVLETLPNHAHLVACLSQRATCEVATHAATFCPVVEKTSSARESVENVLRVS